MLLALPVLVATPGRAEDDAAGAGRFIEVTGDELIQLASGARTLESRRERLQPFLERVVDVDGVGRFCLGRYWQSTTAEQRDAYLRLFRLVLVNSIAGHLGQYEPGRVRIAVGRPSPRPEGVLVPTTIERPNNKPVSISWVVAGEDGRYRINDVVAEGVSLRLTQRSDYSAFLSRNNGEVSALIGAMQQQLDRTRLSKG